MNETFEIKLLESFCRTNEKNNDNTKEFEERLGERCVDPGPGSSSTDSRILST